MHFVQVKVTNDAIFTVDLSVIKLLPAWIDYKYAD